MDDEHRALIIMERQVSLADQKATIKHLNSSVAIDVTSQTSDEQRRIPRVPSQFKKKKRLIKHINVYEPTVVSLGPYHHGKPELRRAELFKDKAVDMFVSSDSQKSLFLSAIMKEIDQIRKCYDFDEDENEYDDQTLSEMMLRDGCFLIHHMETMLGVEQEKSTAMWEHFAVCGISFISHDILLLENQIPLRVLKILLLTTNGGDELDQDDWNTLLCRYAGCISVGSADHFAEPFWEGEPLHFLEIFRLVQLQMVVEEPRRHTISRWLFKNGDSAEEDDTLYKKINYQFRSVTDLKAKGIRIKATDESRIRFTSYPLYGELELVPWFVTHHSLVLFSNIIAYEMTSTSSNLAMTAYVNFMKSLIETTSDVKELRENGLLFGNLGGDDEVLKLFKDMDTLGWDNVDLFSKLKVSIGKHCSSRRKTWLAEFIITYFRSPWTAIALLAAFLLLCLTIIQTTFTVHPASSSSSSSN